MESKPVINSADAAQPVEAAGLILFTRTDPRQFLLMKHADRWDLPKGHAEPNERLDETALRETWEETGIPPAAISIDEHFRFVMEYYVRGKKRGDYHKRVTYFLGWIAQTLPVELTEHIGYQWWQWPVEGPIQAQTIDPLLTAVREHWSR